MVALAEASRAGTRSPHGPIRAAEPDTGPPEALRRRCATVIDAELTRLAHRTSLDGEELAVVAGALQRLADSLLLDRVRAAHCEPPLLAALFDLETTC
ncbi:hypothetical protein [Thermomonospora umbrina]|uniref:Tetrapyrrole biosynthesis glutamyl-tRNA reductase dimerisation domain-containing protein n=1 Tax=Thermomonospora umbrina TaxID=111806 RepID=A0A3D9SWQ9_9ACTN|nr:hypothetical protein [Thermomonospora umbrina]REE97004.1 hypothetical protein DFJ69_2459 [Thermomonospora umbrina]